MRTGNTPLRSVVPLAVVLILLTLVATGCGLAATHTPRASDDWSNGKLVGTAILNEQVALQVDEAGHSFMVWVGLEHELNFARLDEHTEVVVQAPLDLPYNSALKPQLLMDPTGGLHLIWLDRWEQHPQLFYALLSADGEVIQEATVLSLPEHRAAHSTMVLDTVGESVEVFWSDSAPVRPGCYHAALDWSGAVVVPAETLIPNGMLPVAQADRQGFVHLAWRVEPQGEDATFHYAVYDPQSRSLGPEAVAIEPVVQMALLGGPTAGASFEGPWLGLDESSVYLAWVLRVHERGAGLAYTYYQDSPQPALSRPEGAETLDYPLPEVTGEVVHVQGADPSQTGHPRFLEGQPVHQLLTYYTQVSGPGNVETLQIAVLDLLAGQIEGQDIVNMSRAASLQPNLVVDSSGNLHLTWIDTAGFQRYQVVYASNSLQAKETLNRVTVYEVVDKALTTVMNILSALFFIPMILAWVLIPVLWLAIFSTATGASEISDPRGSIALGLAMLLQLGTKVLLFPDLLARFPFSSLLSPSIGPLIGRWITPSLITVLAAGLAWAYRKLARSQSIFASYFIYTVVDSLITLIIYVVLPMA